MLILLPTDQAKMSTYFDEIDKNFGVKTKKTKIQT